MKTDNIDLLNELIFGKEIQRLIKGNQTFHQRTKYLLLFISKASKKTLEQAFKDDSSVVNLESINTKDLSNIWKELIIDAIHFLRINDARERSFLARPQNGNKKNAIEDGESVRKLNAYGIEELYSYFNEFTNFESVLYGADKYYRDHVQHPLYVWLIGLQILGNFVDNFAFRVAGDINITTSPHASSNYSEEQQTKELKKPEVSSAEIGAMWTIVALTHDLGYPLEKVDLINSQMQKMLEKFGKVDFKPSEFSIGHQHSYLVKHLLTILSSSLTFQKNEQNDGRNFITSVRPKYFTKYSKSWEVFDHGMISSLILLRSLTYFLETDINVDNGKNLKFEDARQFAIRSEMLHAIASHTTPKVYHILANNLAFILMLCDDLHEWNRPTMSDLVTNKHHGATKVIINKLHIDKENSHIECSLEFPEHDYEYQRNNAYRIFKTWNERLRPAVDDTKRSMCFKWKIKYANTRTSWIFDFSSHRKVFDEIRITGPTDKYGIKKRPYNIYDEF